MPLADGDAAESWDAWLRVISNPKYLKNDGTLANNAFSGAVVFREPPVRAWSLELSGALLSLMPNLKAYGEAHCGEKFAGFMYQQIDKLYHPPHATDVIYTPTIEPKKDDAHADLVSFMLTIKEKYVLRDWLQDTVICAKPDKLDEIDKLRKAA